MSLLRSSLVSSPLRRVLDDFLSEADLDLLPAAPRLMLSSPDNGFIRLDAYETETGFHIQCDCAGVPKENICCTIENNILTVKATKSKCTSCEGGTFKRQERIFGTCQRTIQLPENINQASAECSNKDGVLCVDFLKIEGGATAKKILIE